MATVVERVGVLETKVQHIDEKIDDLKIDIKEVHDCLDRTGDTLKSQLQLMHDESCKQHNELSSKIADLEKSKDKIMMYALVAMAFAAGAGWVGNANMVNLFKFFGL
jgi:chromosome segregation ATPase